MARITFVTLYDQFSIGIRIMVAALRAAGHEADVVYFRVAKGCRKEAPEADPVGYEVISGGVLLGLVCGPRPWTELEEDLLLDRLHRDPPDIVGFSTRSLFDRHCVPLLRRLRRELPGTLLLAGGFGPMLNPGDYLEAADFVVFGEGEEVILEIADACDQRAPLQGVRNLVYRRDGRLVRNPVRQPEHDLDHHPFPLLDRELICYIQDDRLVEGDPAAPEASVDHPVMVGRGCIGGCGYCSAGQWQALYRDAGCRIPRRRLRSVDTVLRELALIKERGYRIVYFLDSYLAAPKPYLMELFQRYEREIGLPFSANLFPSQVVRSPEILDAACAAGMNRATIGIQHGSERFRREYLSRRVPNDVILALARMFRDRGVQTEYHVIAGIPFETEASLNASLDFVARLPMEDAKLLVFRLGVFPDSPLARLMAARGVPRHVSPERWYRDGALYYLRTVLGDEDFDRCRNAEEFREDTPLLKDLVEQIAGGCGPPPAPSNDPLPGDGPRALRECLATYADLRRDMTQRFVRAFLRSIPDADPGPESPGDGRAAFGELKARHEALLVEALRQRGITVFGSPDLLQQVYRAHLEGLDGRPVVVWGTGGAFEAMRGLFARARVEAIIDNDPERAGTERAGIPVRGPDHLRSCDRPVFICSNAKQDIFLQIKRDYPHITLIP